MNSSLKIIVEYLVDMYYILYIPLAMVTGFLIYLISNFLTNL